MRLTRICIVLSAIAPRPLGNGRIIEVLMA
jgi:hypothetical protein